MTRRRKLTLFAQADARKAALLAIGHLELAADFLDLCCGDDGTTPLPGLEGRDLGGEALGFAATVRHALAQLELAEQP